jgi:hypothetical protein
MTDHTDRDGELVAGARGSSVTADLLYDRDGGLFHTLGEGPIAEHLAEGEQPHYLLQNRKGGLTVESTEGSIEVTPDRRYRAFCLVTDRRLIFLVGGADGDERTVVPYGAVTNVSRSGGLLHDTLDVNTGADRYVFPCEKSVSDRELDAAVAYVDERVAAAADAGEDDPEDAGAVQRVRRLVETAEGTGVSVESLRAHDDAVLERLAEGEAVHYVVEGAGNRGIELETLEGTERWGQADAGLVDSLNQLDRENLTVVTDRRVLALLPRTTDTVAHAVGYDELRAVTVEREEGRYPRLVLDGDDRLLRLELRPDACDVERMTADIRRWAGLASEE